VPDSDDANVTISVVTLADFDELLPLVRGYCDFYRVSPTDSALLALSEALIDNPVYDGLQLIARAEPGRAVGFATLYWTWSTTRAARIGVMNDLFVAAQARGSGVAERLIEACARECQARGAVTLNWQTAPDNVRAQTVYERVGAKREQWVDYFVEVPSS
jgi:GNAT superfamily N-acetyltransferase